MGSLLNLTMLAPERFQSIYNSLSPSEQETMQQILKELSETGESETYEKVWLEDYEEIPVDIDTFLEDPEYLGKATNLGNQIYPFWRGQLRRIFAGGDTEFEEIAFTGAIGTGKTAIAVYAIAYLTYRLLCLKFPQRYFGFADTDEIAVFFFNATVALAQSVGYGRLHACLMESPWFLSHGTVAGSASNPYYVPGKHIVIKAGSKASHGLGQQIFCLVGSTLIDTDQGVLSLAELEGKTVSVLQRNERGQLSWVKAPVLKTRYATKTIRITLENGETIEGTPEHRVMLVDGTYKALGDLTEDDELMDFEVEHA